MTDSIKNVAREAQAAHLREAGASEEVIEATTAVYTGLDALSASQKALMVNNALEQAHAALLTLMEVLAHDPAQAHGIGMYANACIAVAGYANETLREERGETATGDRAVTEVINGIKSLVEVSLKEALDPQHKAMLAEMEARIEARVAAGEPRERVTAEECAAELQKVSGQAPTASAETPAGERNEGSFGFGMYL